MTAFLGQNLEKRGKTWIFLVVPKNCKVKDRKKSSSIHFHMILIYTFFCILFFDSWNHIMNKFITDKIINQIMFFLVSFC